MQMGMEMTRHHLESKAIQQRDKAEIREVLQVIVKSQEDMRTLLSMQSSHPVEEMMESLQTVNILLFLAHPRSGRLKHILSGTKGSLSSARSRRSIQGGIVDATRGDCKAAAIDRSWVTSNVVIKA
jgi:hypothetical protein